MVNTSKSLQSSKQSQICSTNAVVQSSKWKRSMLRRMAQNSLGPFFRPIPYESKLISRRLGFITLSTSRETLSQSSLSEQEQVVVNTYKYNHIQLKKSQEEFNSLLSNTFEKGMEYLKIHKSGPAEACFDKVIACFYDQNTDFLTNSEKIILAKSYTQKARIRCVGSETDEEIALDCLKKALTFLPNLEEALSMQTSIQLNRLAPDLVTYEDEVSDQELTEKTIGATI